MAEEVVKKVKIEIDSAEAIEEIRKVKEALGETNDALKKSQKANEESAKATSSLAKGFSGIGLAIKAAGIGLVLTVLSTLKDLLMSNEKVAKAVATVFNFLQIVMNEVVDVVSNVVTKMTDMWKSMDSTKAVMSGLLTLALTPFKLIIQEISLYIKVLQLAWEKSIFGKGDPGRIKELTEDIKGIGANMKKIAVDAVSAGKDIVTNFGGAMKEIGTAGKEAFNIVSKAVKDFNYESAKNLAEAAANAKKNFGLIAIAAQNEVDKLETIAEKQRQVRDDITKSYEERQKSSKDLLTTLDKELLAMLKLANAHIQEAKLAYETNKNTENLLALKTAQLEVDKAQSDIEGKKSEQLAANNALMKEQADLQKQLAEGKLADKRAEEDFQNSRILDDKTRIENQIKLEEARKEADLQNIQDIIDKTKEGEIDHTNALLKKSNLETDYIIKLGQLNDDLEKAKKDNAKFEFERNMTLRKQVIDNQIAERNDIQKTLKERIASAQGAEEKQLKLAEQRKKVVEKYLSDELNARLKGSELVYTQLEQQERDYAFNVFDAEQKLYISLRDEKRRLVDEANKYQLDQAASLVSTLQSTDQSYTQMLINNEQQKLKEKKISQEEYDKNVAKIQEKAAKREKAYAISAAIISTAQAIIGFLAAKPVGPWNWVQSAAAAVAGAAQIMKIKSTPTSTQGGDAGGITAPATATTEGTSPNTSFSFSPSATAPVSNQPIKTYVLSKDVTTANQLDRAIIANGSI